MLSYLVNCNSFISVAYMNDIYDMICQLYHLHLDPYFIKQEHDLNFRYLCMNYCVYTSSFIYMFGQVK